jgi:hypothetical protein
MVSLCHRCAAFFCGVSTEFLIISSINLLFNELSDLYEADVWCNDFSRHGDRFRIKRHVTHQTHQSRATELQHTASAYPSVLGNVFRFNDVGIFSWYYSVPLGKCTPDTLQHLRISSFPIYGSESYPS